MLPCSLGSATKKNPERLTIGCGLYNPERPEGSHPNQKGLLRNAAIRLLCTILAPGQNDQDDEELAQYKKVCKDNSRGDSSPQPIFSFASSTHN